MNKLRANKLRAATIIFGAIALLALVGPLIFAVTAGSSMAGAPYALVFFFVGWLIVAPIAALVALLLGLALSLRALRAHDATNTTRVRVIVWWVCLFVAATLLWLFILFGFFGGTPVAGIGAAFAVATGLGLAVVAIAGYSSPQQVTRDRASAAPSSSTRRTRITLIAFGAAGVLAAGFIAPKLSLLAEYGRVADMTVLAETQLQELQQEAELNLASACFMLPDARQALEQAPLFENARPPALPAELADSLHQRTADAVDGLAGFDPSVCEQAAARVETAVLAHGRTLTDIDWRETFAPSELTARFPTAAPPERGTPPLWAISAADIREVEERNRIAYETLTETRNGEAEIAREAASIVSAPLFLITGDLRSAAPEGAEGVIREAGTEGSAAAAALREAAAASLADAPMLEQEQALIEYLRQAIVMLDG